MIFPRPSTPPCNARVTVLGIHVFGTLDIRREAAESDYKQKTVNFSFLVQMFNPL